ncbi:hypothetical protein DEU56DRAFT_919746 [Suillus clintonianus]|uniref:uncharacterized protein n=1 Tax=Suillus clintonianus TaxID=1904413 RepID=UPI001B86426E|nr:uncharacterized protein DEU56DRAFT_919746 [Suillus clintonianus]KAG2112874.1 hypothetical protein DEU56DRAFT_919746 [Suillus clintonianus]
MTTTTNNDQSSLDAVLQLLSSLTLSNDEAQTLIQVISDGSGGPPVMSSATPTAAVIPAATLAPAVTVISPPPAVAVITPRSAVAVVSPPAVAVETQAAAFVQFVGFPHLPMTAVIVNGETRGQQQYRDFSFDVPRAGALGPFYLVTRGRRVGVFETWQRTSPHVLGVSCSSFSCCKSLDDSLVRMLDAIDLGEAQWLP